MLFLAGLRKLLLVDIRPNLVTLIGFFFIIAMYLLTAYYHPTLLETAPSWVYFVDAAFLWVYQTMVFS